MLRGWGLGLVGGEVVSLGWAVFYGGVSKGRIVRRREIAEKIAALDRDIEAYGVALDENDAAEAAAPAGDDRGAGDMVQKVAALMAKRAQAQADLDGLAQSGETQLSRTDADARLLTKCGQTVAGYNVQIAVDEKHKLIVASEVVNDGNDTGQLYAMARAAKEALGVERLQAVADVGYYNGETLRACEADAIVAYVPEADRNQRLSVQGRFTAQDFVYDAADDVYRCPAGGLWGIKGDKRERGGALYICYVRCGGGCGGCVRRESSVSAKGRGRAVYIGGYMGVFSRGRARVWRGGALCAAGGSWWRISFGRALAARRIPPLPAARLRQGARRMEPDGALLQLHPRAEHPRHRPVPGPPGQAP